jgi:hypothetical protein
MADLLSGGVAPATTNGDGASASRPTAPPMQTGSPQIRGPRVIMRERAEREARRAEREQIERARTEEEARLREEQRRRAAERRQSAAGAGTTPGGEIPTDPATQRRQQRAQENQANAAPTTPRMQQATTAGQQSVPQTAPLRTTRVPTSTQQPQGFANAPPMATAAVSAPAPQASEPATAAAGTVVGTRTRNSFPHAFERWEALSAHWEGMTSFWIRKLQENTDELDRNPVSSQLSRQVGDLSAAGANLFHAVVELQRLRASSERKFQRWFFETRGEMERLKESNGILQAALDQERLSRASAIRDAVEQERANSKTQKQLGEMRRELLISKDEARRAWEELGRREQEERDRTISLQQGQPTVVGGVQVVPMTQGVPGRSTSVRDTRSQSQGDASDYPAALATGFHGETSQAVSGQSETSAAGPGGGYYQAPQPPTEAGDYRPVSEGGFSEGEYVIDVNGNFVRDVYGNKIPYQGPNSPTPGARASNDAAEDYETPVSQAPPTTSYPPSSSQWAGYANAPEYSGQGYAAPGWDTLPRHHHPTRLSDVIEEDERSRTSASQVSRP